MMQYLAWRVLVGKHKTIILSFLIVGHTKFAPDLAFGLFKQKFRKTKVDCLDNIAEKYKLFTRLVHSKLFIRRSAIMRMSCCIYYFTLSLNRVMMTL